MAADGQITVYVVASPIPSHPATHIIDCTVESVRTRLPEARILVLFDGCPPDRGDRLPAYRQHIDTIRDKVAAGAWGNCEVVVFDRWSHQSQMTRHALDMTNTPLVLFVEADCPLVGPIDFDKAAAAVASGGVNMLRFHYGTTVGSYHLHMYPDQLNPRDVAGCQVLRTSQWSQRPHLADAVWYRRVLDELVPAAKRTMIEDAVHGAVSDAWVMHGEAGWDRFRLAVYCQDGVEDMLRSAHLDGRAGEAKRIEA